MPKLVLDNDLIAEAFFENTCLLGVVASMEDYHFCNLVKHELGFDFRNDLSSEIAFTKRARKYYFSVFKYQEANSSVVHYIYANKCDGDLLLPEFKHLDFVWLICVGEGYTYPIQQLMQAVKAIKGVQLITELTNEKIKNKQHLVL
ncbi:MAG: IPExxxVDY family protein [Chitinophagaceae bacterium]